MTTLHIEHAITGFDTWKSAFDRFAQKRTAAGVISHRISQPVDQLDYIVIDLEFDSPAAAQHFETFLREQVWSNPQMAPGLAGAPRTLVLDLAPSQ